MIHCTFPIFFEEHNLCGLSIKQAAHVWIFILSIKDNLQNQYIVRRLYWYVICIWILLFIRLLFLEKKKNGIHKFPKELNGYCFHISYGKTLLPYTYTQMLLLWRFQALFHQMNSQINQKVDYNIEIRILRMCFIKNSKHFVHNVFVLIYLAYI